MYIFAHSFTAQRCGVLVYTDIKQFAVINFQCITVIPCKVTVKVKSESRVRDTEAALQTRS